MKLRDEWNDMQRNVKLKIKEAQAKKDKYNETICFLDKICLKYSIQANKQILKDMDNLIQLDETVTYWNDDSGCGIQAKIVHFKIKELLEHKENEFMTISDSLITFDYLSKLDDGQLWENYADAVPYIMNEDHNKFLDFTQHVLQRLYNRQL